MKKFYTDFLLYKPVRNTENTKREFNRCYLDFLHCVLHARVSKNQVLIIHTIFDVYPHNNFINKGLSIFQKNRMRYDTS